MKTNINEEITSLAFTGPQTGFGMQSDGSFNMPRGVVKPKKKGFLNSLIKLQSTTPIVVHNFLKRTNEKRRKKHY